MRVLRLQKYSAKPLLFHHFVSVVYFSYIHFQIYLPSHLTQNSQSFARIGFLYVKSLVWLPLATSLWLTHVQCRSQLRVRRGRFCNVKPARRIVPVISGCWCRFLNTHLRRTYPKSIKLSSLNYDLISIFLPSWRRRSEYNTVSGSNSFAEASSV